jgi:hypothetical protein
MRLDSVFIDSLNKHADIRVKGSAPAAIRAAVQNLREAKQSSRVLATYAGGKLTEGDLARWMQAFAPQTIVMIGQAADSMLELFIKSIARNAMLIHSAEQRHIGLTAADQNDIRTSYRSELENMTRRMGVAPESLAVDTAARRSRPEAVARRVERFFEDIVASSPRHVFFDVQPFLADVLRGRYAWSISPLGVDRALAKATQLRGPTTPATPSRPGASAPAPGGPPMSAQPPAPSPTPPGKSPAPSRPKPRT